MNRYGLGPVFAFEWLRAARRWQMYAMRSLFALSLLAAIGIVFLFARDRPWTSPIRRQAEIGQMLFYLATGTQIALLMLAAPAATASGFCLDKARGVLLHLLVTDLSSTEIVLGRLAARLGAVLGLVCCSVPILFFCTLFGGVDPDALIGAYLVSLGIAVFGCSLALALSVWGKRTHEVLLVTYMVWVLALLSQMLLGRLLPFVALLLAYVSTPFRNGDTVLGWDGSVPYWMDQLNPFWVTYAPYWVPGTTSWREPVGFLLGSVVGAALLTTLAIVRIRAVTVRQASAAVGPRRRRGFRLRLPRLLGPSLDSNPIAWREWHRKRINGWSGLVVLVYAVVSIIFTVIGIEERLSGTGAMAGRLGAFTAGLQVAVGLLFICIGAVTALSEERVRGSLDVILMTPLPTWQIVWGKWWGTFRTVPWVIFLPCLLITVLAYERDAWACPALLLPLLLAYGAFFTSVGLHLATAIARFSRAVTVAAVFYVAMTVGWVVLLILTTRGPSDDVFALGYGSPAFGTVMLAAFAVEGPQTFRYELWTPVWIVGLCAVAFAVLLLNMARFNSHMGRVSNWARFLPAPPAARRPGSRSEPVHSTYSP
jgi:ABC-type transport system involved in multi-copper enzyme maturation permease subunit